MVIEYIFISESVIYNLNITPKQQQIHKYKFIRQTYS